MKKYAQALTATTILLAGTQVAFAEFDPFLEFILMGGVATVDTDDTNLVITQSETDKLVGSNSDWDSWTGQLGVGYVMPLASGLETGAVQWFPVINPQINFYHIGNTDLDGDVWRFESSDFNQATYAMDLHSTRVMFDLAFTVAAIEQFSVYALAGAGIAYNGVDFSAMSRPGLDCPIEDINLDEENSSGFAYEFGGGLTYAATDRVAVSLEYLYTVLTDVELGDDTGSRFNVAGPDMDINSQAVLLGLRFAL